MSGSWTVCRKELLDGVRDRRALASVLLFGPLFGPVLLGVMLAVGIEAGFDDAQQPIRVPIVGGKAAPNLMDHLSQYLIDVDHDAYDDVEALRRDVRSGSLDVGVVVAEDFGAALQAGSPARVWVVTDDSNSGAHNAAGRVRRALGAYGRMVADARLRMRGIDPAFGKPLAVLNDDQSTSASRAVLLLGMMTYLLLISVMAGGMPTAVDATAGERERGSLEPLLTLPVARDALVIGKTGAAALFMAASTAIAILSFAVATRLLPLADLGMTANFTPAVCAAMFLALMPFAVLGAAAMTIVASFAKTFKEAQSWVGFAMLAPTLPIVVLVIKPLQASAPLMLVPGLAQHLLVTGLIRGEAMDPLHLLVSAVSMVSLAALLTYLTIKRYRSEKLLI